MKRIAGLASNVTLAATLSHGVVLLTLSIFVPGAAAGDEAASESRRELLATFESLGIRVNLPPSPREATALWFSARSRTSPGAISDLINVLPGEKVLNLADAVDADLKSLDAIDDLTHLRVGWLRGCDVTDGGLKRLSRLSNLTYLSLTSPHITDDGVLALGSLRKLEGLEIVSPKLTGDGLLILKEMPKLQTLLLSSPHLGDAEMRQIAELRDLAQLFLDGTTLGDAGLGALSTIESLRFLSVDAPRSTNQGVGLLCRLRHLTYLSLSSENVTRHVGFDLQQMQSRDLTALVLASPKLSPDDGRVLQQLLPTGRLVIAVEDSDHGGQPRAPPRADESPLTRFEFDFSVE